MSKIPADKVADWLKTHEELDNGQIATKIAILKAESNLDSDAVNVNSKHSNAPGSRDRGLAQINDYYFPEVTDEQAFDPEFSTHFIATRSNTLWNAYKSGAHGRHLALGWVALRLSNALDAREADLGTIIEQKSLLEQATAALQDERDEVLLLERELTDCENAHDRNRILVEALADAYGLI